MKTMKRCLCLLPLSGALACAADLAAVHSVYLLPMSRGMDQYLANQIASAHVFQVVTDPKLADAVLTDHLGESFQAQLEEISPTPKPPAPEKAPDKAAVAEPAVKAVDESAAASKPAAAEPPAKADEESTPPAKPVHPKAKSKSDDETITPSLLAKTENTLTNPASGFSRARGTVFLVDAKSRQVLWSTYAPPKDSAGKEMNRTATDIVSRLKRDLKPKK